METPVGAAAGDPRELLSILDDTAGTLQRKGQLAEAANVLWQALHLRIQVLGRDAPEVGEAARDIIKFLNSSLWPRSRMATTMHAWPTWAKAQLSLAWSLARGFRILTLNNASCCHRRLGNTQQALRCAKDH